MIQTLQQSAAGGVVRWGVHHRGKLQPAEKWITLPVEPIIDAKTYSLVKELCEQRRPTEFPGRGSAKPRVLTGLARCGLRGSSYQLETSGKSLDGATYSYCYYNCRRTLRAGKKACPGFRVRVEDLDGAVLAAIADVACAPERASRLARRHQWPPTAEVITAYKKGELLRARVFSHYRELGLPIRSWLRTRSQGSRRDGFAPLARVPEMRTPANPGG